MTPERIAEIRRLAEAATKGPWTAKEPAFAPGIKARVFGPTYKGKFEGQETMAVPDADFIAAAREAVPELLDDVDRLEARVKELSNPATWRATINRLESAELAALAELDERIAENAALKARVEKLEEVRKAAMAWLSSFDTQIPENADSDYVDKLSAEYTDTANALRAALDRAGEG